MSPLEDKLQELEALTRKSYTVEQIQCAALMIIAENVASMDETWQELKILGEAHDGAD